MKTKHYLTLTISALLIGFAIIFYGCKKDVEDSITNLKDTRDGHVYAIVKIGNQTWMAENLNYDAGSGSWAYDNYAGNAETYGLLYDWETACEVCPDGWHLPGDAEWAQVIDYLGGANVAGDKMKSSSGWSIFYDCTGTNSSGLIILPGGLRYGSSGNFSSLGLSAFFWSSTGSPSTYAWSLYLHCDYAGVDRYLDSDKINGMSVRCLKD